MDPAPETRHEGDRVGETSVLEDGEPRWFAAAAETGVRRGVAAAPKEALKGDDGTGRDHEDPEHTRSSDLAAAEVAHLSRQRASGWGAKTSHRAASGGFRRAQVREGHHHWSEALSLNAP